MPGECIGLCAKSSGMQGNSTECQGNVWEWVQIARVMQGMQGNAREMEGNTGECQGNERESVQSARGMQVNAKKCQVNV